MDQNKKMLTFGSMFAGIGGFDLGFERAGMRCEWQVEIDQYCQRVLAKHWPTVRRWDDVRTFPPSTAESWSVDVICGGFPCQDVSHAGKRAGLAGERSGLFFDLARVVRTLRPRVVVLENVAAITSDGLDVVLGELAESGFDAQWDCIPAEAIGACHERDRAFVIAYAAGERCRSWWTRGLADRASWLQNAARWDIADTDGTGLEERQSIGSHAREKFATVERDVISDVWQSKWPDEPALLGVDDGVPDRMDRTRAIGNSVVPQVAEWIGRRIIECVEK